MEAFNEAEAEIGDREWPAGHTQIDMAEDLATELGFPLLMRDTLKETMMHRVPVNNLDESQAMGAAAFLFLVRVIDQLVTAGVDQVVESSFTRGRGEDELAPFPCPGSGNSTISACPPTDVIACALSHPHGARRAPSGHQDQEDRMLLERDEFSPLDLDIPLIEVDATNGFNPTVAQIAGRIVNQLVTWRQHAQVISVVGPGYPPVGVIPLRRASRPLVGTAEHYDREPCIRISVYGQAPHRARPIAVRGPASTPRSNTHFNHRDYPPVAPEQQTTGPKRNQSENQSPAKYACCRIGIAGINRIAVSWLP